MSVRRHQTTAPTAQSTPPAWQASGLVRLIVALVLAVGLTGIAVPNVNAARDAGIETAAAITGSDAASNLQLVVLEAPGCTYCNLFRRYVVPAYETSPKSRTIPMKFIDMNDEAYGELGLDAPVDMVPTTILMQNNREVGRIPGYLGPENFFRAVNHLMARVN